MDLPWNGHQKVAAWLPVLVLALIAAGFVAFGPHHELSDDIIGSLVGALIGAAAVISGVLLDRWQRRFDEIEAADIRRRKVKELIAAELVNVALGLIEAKKYFDVAVRNAGRTRMLTTGISDHQPRTMSLTDSLGAELLVLTSHELDLLAAVKSNLMLTSLRLQQAADNDELYFPIVEVIRNGVIVDMKTVAGALADFVPERMLKIGHTKPELASVVLARLAEVGESDGAGLVSIPPR